MNKLPWFTHDNDAHTDGWIRHIVRNQGHVAGWLWWVILELHHKHGVGDILKRDINDIAKDGLTSASVVVRVLTEMATEYEGQTKVSFTLVGSELQLEIKKLRERQAKLKSKIPSTFPQHSVNTPIHIEGEGERDRDKEKTTDVGRTIPPKIEWVREFCKERKNSVDPDRFFAHYESNGWKVGKNPMKSWKAAICGTWEKNNGGFNGNGTSQKRIVGSGAEPIPGKYDHLG